jgi:hypothetical protein
MPPGILTGNLPEAGALHGLQTGLGNWNLGRVGGPQQISLQLTSDLPGLGKARDVLTFALHPSDLHQAEEIDTFMAGYSNPLYRADEAVPLVTVQQLTDQFRVFTKANAFRVANVLASIQGAVNEVDPETVLDTYLCVDRALGGFIPLVTQTIAGRGASFDPRQATARRIANALALEREVRIWGPGGLLTASANWATNNVLTLGSGAEWDHASTPGNPIKNLQDMEERSLAPITDWWMPTPSFNAFLRNANVVNHMRQMLGDNAPSNDIVARATDVRIPGLAPIHKVEGKVLNESTGNVGYIMGDSVVGTRTLGQNTNPEDIQTAVTFRFNGPSGTGFITREFPVQGRGLHGGTMLVSGYSEDPKFIARDVGALIINVNI